MRYAKGVGPRGPFFFSNSARRATSPEFPLRGDVNVSTILCGHSADLLYVILYIYKYMNLYMTLWYRNDIIYICNMYNMYICILWYDLIWYDMQYEIVWKWDFTQILYIFIYPDVRPLGRERWTKMTISHDSCSLFSIKPRWVPSKVWQSRSAALSWDMCRTLKS